jgi:23S rRNA (adenine2030-N6)-methyltransferase
MALDAWTALKALLPPPERRGVMLIDPAFEQTGELARLVGALKEAARRFATGTFLLWYPIKEMAAVAAFRREVTALGLPKATAIELMIRGPADETRLNGAGLLAVNAPFTLSAKLDALLPELARVLAQGDGAGFKVEQLGTEAV